MSIQPESAGRDLDRTDELPILDLDLYEANLVEVQGGLSRTDAWQVGALHAIDEVTEEAEHDGLGTLRARPAVAAEALTLNVGRILKRIAELEADVAAAHEANAALRKRNEVLESERDQANARAQGLEREAARLTEQRELADALAQRSEVQRREQSERTTAQFQELQGALLAERSRADQEREHASQRIAQLDAEAAALREEARTLHDRLTEIISIAEERGAELAVAERTLHEERAGAQRLAWQLAAKLAEHEKLSTVVEGRNRIIATLSTENESLAKQLEEMTVAHTASAAQGAATETALADARRALAERDALLAEKDARLEDTSSALEQSAAALAAARDALAARTHEWETLEGEHSGALERLAQLGASLQASEIRELQLRDELTGALAALEQQTPVQQELEARARAAQEQAARLQGELEAAQTQIRILSSERDALKPLMAEMNARTADLEAARASIAQLSEQLLSARDEIDAGVRAVHEARDELAQERAESAEHVRTLHEVEQALEARDEIAAELKAQLQTVQDERTALSNQVEKLRARVKTLSQQIFSRDNQLAELQSDLAIHMEALAAIRSDVNRIGEEELDANHATERVLEPVGHDGTPIVLNGKTFTIGRTLDNDICIGSNLISRRHARLLVGPNGVILEDVGSRNGCFVNGEQVRQRLMRDGDVLELGNIRYRLSTRKP